MKLFHSTVRVTEAYRNVKGRGGHNVFSIFGFVRQIPVEFVAFLKYWAVFWLAAASFHPRHPR